MAKIDGYEVREAYAGRVVSRRESDLGFERGGRLDAVLVDQGDRVEQGQTLARLDMRELRAQRRELVARKQQIEAQLGLARVTPTRRQALHEAGHLATQSLDETRFNENALAAQALAAQAAIENVDVRLDLSAMRAPYAGRITERLEDEGTVVRPGQAILRLIEDRVLEVHIGVPPETASGLSEGERHEVEIGSARLGALLHSVLATVEPDTRTVRAIFRLEDPPATVRSGALARIALTRRIESEGFWLPIEALAESRRGLWSAYAVIDSPDGGLRVERRQLDLVHTEADRAYVRGTLRDGDRIVVSGVHRLVPGQRVRLSEVANLADGR